MTLTVKDIGKRVILKNVETGKWFSNGYRLTGFIDDRPVFDAGGCLFEGPPELIRVIDEEPARGTK